MSLTAVNIRFKQAVEEAINQSAKRVMRGKLTEAEYKYECGKVAGMEEARRLFDEKMKEINRDE